VLLRDYVFYVVVVVFVDAIMADFSPAFMKAVEEQNDLMEKIQKPVTSVTLRQILIDPVEIDSRRLTKNVPFYKWIDDCYKTMDFFRPHRITTEDFESVAKTLSKLITSRRLNAAKVPELLNRMSDTLDKIPYTTHQITNFLNDLCDYCSTFQKWHNRKTVVRLNETVSERSLAWLLEFAHAIGTLLLANGSIREFQLCALCLAPNVLWILFNAVDPNGAQFARGIEVIQNTVKAEGRVFVVDDAMGHFLQSVRLSSIGREYIDAPEGLLLRPELIVLDDIPVTRDISIDGLVLPTPYAVLSKSSWNIAVKAGCTVSMALMGVLVDSTDMALDTNTGAVVTRSRCAAISWSDLCAFHFWPYISEAVEKKPNWGIDRKRAFVSAVAYFNGGDDDLAKFVSNESWWAFLPFIDSVTLFTTELTEQIETREHIIVPLENNSYSVWSDFTFCNRHSIWQNTSAFVTVTCARRYEDCMCWLLEQMFFSSVSKKDAVRLHPLLRDEYHWTRIALPPEVLEESKDTMLFRVLHPAAQLGESKIKELLGVMQVAREGI